tara:strand:+ start:108 stop:1391 length:1284 start_codon:yes stop_codon:yes gene_type:complete
MPKVLPAIFSYEDMKSRFAQDNPDDPYTRRADLESGIYALDSWLIRVDDDNKAISTVGFKEHPSHTVVGGMYASAKGREIGGNNRALQIAREPQLNQSKPLVAAFGHRDGDNARWIAKAKQNGWKFPEDNDFQQVSQMLPEQIVNAWNSAYPNGNWAIRSIRGEGDFAKCVFIDDPTPAWFNLLKSNQRGWRDIIKWQPSQPPYEKFTGYNTDSGGYVSMIHEELNNPETMETTDNRFIVTGHYIYRGKGGEMKGDEPARVPKHIANEESLQYFGEKIMQSGFDAKRGYFPVSKNSKVKVLFDIVDEGEYLPQQQGTDIRNNSGGKVIVFTTMFATDEPEDSKYFPMWDDEEESEQLTSKKPENNQLTVKEAEKMFNEYGVSGYTNTHRVKSLLAILKLRGTDENKIKQIEESLQDYADGKAESGEE